MEELQSQTSKWFDVRDMLRVIPLNMALQFDVPWSCLRMTSAMHRLRQEHRSDEQAPESKGDFSAKAGSKQVVLCRRYYHPMIREGKQH